MQAWLMEVLGISEKKANNYQEILVTDNVNSIARLRARIFNDPNYLDFMSKNEARGVVDALSGVVKALVEADEKKVFILSLLTHSTVFTALITQCIARE